MPVLTSATVAGPNLTIIGTTGAGYTIELFDVTNGGTIVVNVNGGEGPVYLGEIAEGSGADSDAAAGAFTFTLSGTGLVSGDIVTITATNISNTSQFSLSATIP